MAQPARHQCLILSAALVLFFTGLGNTHLWDKDETIYSTCAREMFQRQDWIVPTFNDQLFPDKPPLMYWLMMTGFELFGVSEFATRFWSAVFGVATALATYQLGRLLFRPEVGFWAALAVASNIMLAVSARAATIDSALTCLTTLGMLSLVVGTRIGDTIQRAECRGQTESSGSASSMPRRSSLVLLYATMGCGLLAKGPIGLILPLTSAGLFLLILSAWQSSIATERTAGPKLWRLLPQQVIQILHPQNVWRTVCGMRPLTALAVVLCIAAPWYVWVGIRTDGEWLRKFFIEQNVGRALRPYDQHGGSLLYYLLAISVGFFPWSVFMPGAVIQLVRSLRHDEAQRSSYLLLACWIGVYLGFWSLVSTKLPHYVLPAYPAIALMTAVFIHERVINAAHVSLLWTRYAAVWLLAIGLAIAVALPLVARKFVPGEECLGLIGLIPMVAGVWCLGWFERMQPRIAMGGFVVTSLVLILALFTVAAQRVDRHQTAHVILQMLRERGDNTKHLVAYRYLQESYVFYAGHSIEFAHDPQGLRTLVTNRLDRQVLTTTDQLCSIETAFPGRFREVARAPRFLKPGHVVVLGQVATANLNGPSGNRVTAADDEQECHYLSALDDGPLAGYSTPRQ